MRLLEFDPKPLPHARPYGPKPDDRPSQKTLPRDKPQATKPQSSAMRTPSSARMLAPITISTSQEFKGSRHRGVDLYASIGTAIIAPEDGYVTQLNEPGGAGLYVELTTRTGVHKFFHLSNNRVANGRVKQGTVIGYSGNTGKSTGPHLHWELWINGSPVDPLRYIG